DGRNLAWTLANNGTPGKLYLMGKNPAVRRTSAGRESVQRSGVGLVHAPGCKDLVIHGHQGAVLRWHRCRHAQRILQILDAIVACRPAWPHGSSKDNGTGNRRDLVDE